MLVFENIDDVLKPKGQDAIRQEINKDLNIINDIVSITLYAPENRENEINVLVNKNNLNIERERDSFVFVKITGDVMDIFNFAKEYYDLDLDYEYNLLIDQLKSILT